ncbi:GTP-binding protein [Craurococcus roseus]|uniref:GTP-binding protein n=1 Tax=Craurococcus roseus TaxID=77585 RepID=A0ABP3PQS0_9PROT
MIPVLVLTGFLGAGKTTLLGRLLHEPAWADTAVVVNEFGEVALDHALVAASEDTLVSLSTGCLCCAARGDLAETLLDLWRRREAGAVPRYARVVVETSGLADPAPILHALMADAALAETHSLLTVAALVDAVHGGAALDRHPEARRQAMLADRLVLTKTDLAPDTAALEARLRSLNPAAPILAVGHGSVPPDWLLAPGAAHGGWADPDALAAWLDAVGGSAAPRHSPGLAAIAIERDAPIPAAALALWMEGLVEHAGRRLLRLKGIVRLAEAPERPLAVHAIGHVAHPPRWLDRWPAEGNRRSRLVLIGQGIPRHFPARLLAAVEAEVAEESGVRAGGSGHSTPGRYLGRRRGAA